MLDFSSSQDRKRRPCILKGGTRWCHRIMNLQPWIKLLNTIFYQS